MSSNSNSNNKIKLIGKVAEFPKGAKGFHAYAYLENIKIPKNRIWYILIQKQDSELSMLKYNKVEGVNLVEFVGELRNYYRDRYEGESALLEGLDSMVVTGEDKFSVIKNIPSVNIDGVPLITRIAQDLIKLLAI